MKIKLWIVIGALLSIAFLETGCATGSYQDNGFYGTPINDRMTRMAEQYEGPLRNPVIVIHGLLGAKFQIRTEKQSGDISLRLRWRREHIFRDWHTR